ncbi:hypothetical protein, partial [Escherichia coli]|uniref:hypothetical protein n=1 Tax=Escherichia coli TaxID=562 RepID=UPI000F85E73B
RGKPPEWWEKQKGSRGIRREQWYRLFFQFPIRERPDPSTTINRSTRILLFDYHALLRVKPNT